MVVVPLVVHHRTWGGASSHLLALSRVQVGTALGVAVPPDKEAVPAQAPPSRPGLAGHRHRGGGASRAAPRAKFHLLFFVFFTTFANVLTLQVFHHHMQVC